MQGWPAASRSRAIYFRDGDFWQEAATDFNRISEQLQQFVRSGERARQSPPERLVGQPNQLVDPETQPSLSLDLVQSGSLVSPPRPGLPLRPLPRDLPYEVAMMQKSYNKRRGARPSNSPWSAPLLFLVVFAIFEFGRAFMVIDLVGDAARVGCREGAVQSKSSATITSDVQARLGRGRQQRQRHGPGQRHRGRPGDSELGRCDCRAGDRARQFHYLDHPRLPVGDAFRTIDAGEGMNTSLRCTMKMSCSAQGSGSRGVRSFFAAAGHAGAGRNGDRPRGDGLEDPRQRRANDAQVAVQPASSNATVTSRINSVLTANNITAANATITIKVNGVVADVSTASPNDKMSVTVSIPASSTSLTNFCVSIFQNATFSSTLTVMRLG